jgi:hypothetical protein
MKLLKSLEKSFSCWFLIAISFVFFILRFPSLFEPNWYGDEGIYQVLGLGINAGRLLYTGIFDNKPPLLYLFYSFVSSDQFMIRLISLIFGLLAVLAFYLLSKKILATPKATYIATSFFAVLFGLPLIEGNIANAENFMLFPNILTAILVLKALEKNDQSKKMLFFIFSGIILGISFLIKIVAVFDFAAFFVFIFIANLPKNFIGIFGKEALISEFKNLTAFTISFLIPIFLTTLFFILNGSLSYFLKAVLFNNVGYVGYGNTFIIPQGFLIFKLILLCLFLLFVFLRRKTLGNAFVLTSIWFAFSLFNAYFSQRPYTHYVLVLLPSLSLMLGFFFLNNKLSKLSGVLILSSFIAILLSFNFYIKTVFYYQNFISFIMSSTTVNNYQKFFDRNTPKDYAIADYISIHAKTNDNIFIWGNNAQVYTLTNKLPPGRYTVAYHITNYKDGIANTKDGLIKYQPKFIVIMPNASEYPFSLQNYYLKINLSGINIYEKFF